ncbi:MAG: hypothetical protein ACHQPH_04000 [Reyranellales bacterium]
MIDTLGSIPNDTASKILKGSLETDRQSWLRLQARARSATLSSYDDMIVAFASPPVAGERSAYLSDMMPPRFEVYLELTVRKV